MPLGGKLVLKGGETLKTADKKIKKKKKVVAAEPENEGEQQAQEQAPNQQGKPKAVDPKAVNVMTGKTYEQEFDFETKRIEVGKTRSTPWGSTSRAPPEILHGYTHKIKGDTAANRLDIRCASRADKFCK